MHSEQYCRLCLWLYSFLMKRGLNFMFNFLTCILSLFCFLTIRQLMAVILSMLRMNFSHKRLYYMKKKLR
ncbi:hypothetical protein E1A91_D11G155000v1 [Gossypium mustelinum]|uniref:Uncharacterized protein n=1 Tax=Gossypium mustelinum TaxID=34275 RepID=A0A5D2STE0_GOSMU|nr:hypothetical protein E1A91_D11G155000v1 [Gossypium mustelinum]